MDLLLINPGKIRHDYLTEHLGIASLKAYTISKGFFADTLDMSIEELSVQDGLGRIMNLDPKIAGFSLLDDSKHKGLALIKALRKSGYTGKIIVGGYFATFAAPEILRDFPEIDFVIRGEGEITLAELMQTLLRRTGKPISQISGLSFRDNRNIIDNPARPLIQNLDSLPPPDRKYARMILDKNFHLRVYSTRGCWGQCTFCDIIGMYRSSPGKVWRSRSIKNLVGEIENLQKQFHTNFFIFNDDQFLLKGVKGQQRAEAFASEIKKRGLDIKFELMSRADTIHRATIVRLKSVGLQRVFLGLESFDDRQLKRFKKGISVRQNFRALITLYQLKIDVLASVILADAYTTLWDLVQQFITLFELRRRYFNSNKCQISVNNKLEIYRGSAVYREYKCKGLLTTDHYLEGNDYKINFWTNIRLKMFELEGKAGRFILKPGDVIQNMIRTLRWYYYQLRLGPLYDRLISKA
jgi:anaerobic magnesium-protoporphyrin IX monomethyl ester cyclase